MHVGIFLWSPKKDIKCSEPEVTGSFEPAVGLQGTALRASERRLINHRALFPPLILMFNLKLLNKY